MSKRVTVIVEGREYLVEVGDLHESPIKATVKGRTYEVELPQKEDAFAVESEAGAPSEPVSQDRDTSALAGSNAPITAPMPGDILEVTIRPGDHVNAGDVVCVLEAMKMKNLIHTSFSGVVASVEVAPGQTVDFGDLLVTFE